jgi:hypothetical protein
LPQGRGFGEVDGLGFGAAISLNRSMVDVNGGVSHRSPLPETSKLNM